MGYFHSCVFRYAKYVDLEKEVIANEEDELIHKVLANTKTKRKLSIDDDDDDNESCAESVTKEVEPPINEETDLKWAANYIEEQQTQLILSLLDTTGEKRTNDDEDEQKIVDKEEDFKSPGPSLETMGIGKL
jgi:hypothetical protein